MSDLENSVPNPGTPAAPPKLKRQHLHDTVVNHLRKMIIDAVFEPGMKLNERELCEALGISRTPLREALKVLAAEGLINLAPNRGASVYRMSAAEAWESFEIISGLEAMAGRLACERISVAEIDCIKMLNDKMLICKSNSDLPGYYKHNQEIHDKIFEAARNSLLQRTYLTINLRLKPLRQKSNLEQTRWDQAANEHLEMIEALEAGDGDRLASILTTHLLYKRSFVMHTLGDVVPDAFKDS